MEKRAIGTKMDNPKVIETVLQQGKPFQSTNTILGREYNTAYWPLRDIKGKIAGMLFIGKDRAPYETQREIVRDGGDLGAGDRRADGVGGVFHRAVDRGPDPARQRGLVDQYGTRSRRASRRRCPGRARCSPDGAAEQAAAIEETSSCSRKWPA